MSTELPTVEGGPGGERCDRCYFGECRLVLDADGRWGGHFVQEEKLTVKEYEEREEAYSCRRHPKQRMVYSDDWCGEFRPRAGENGAGGGEQDVPPEVMAVARMSAEQLRAMLKRAEAMGPAYTQVADLCRRLIAIRKRPQ